MARGFVDVAPADLAEFMAVLPRGLTVHGSQTSGGVVRLIINGPGIKKDADYQFVMTDEPLRRVIELTESPA